jgi:hypothetical protein
MIHSNGLILKTVATKNAYVLEGDHEIDSHWIEPVKPLGASLAEADQEVRSSPSRGAIQILQLTIHCPALGLIKRSLVTGRR